jgi:multidrug efflux pump subunit AcrB
MGYYIVVVQLPDGASFERTDEVVRRMDALAREMPGVAHTFAISGYSSVLQANQPNVGAAFLVLDDFDNRQDPALRGDALLAMILRRFSSIQEGRVLVLPPRPARPWATPAASKSRSRTSTTPDWPALDGAAPRCSSRPAMARVSSPSSPDSAPNVPAVPGGH